MVSTEILCSIFNFATHQCLNQFLSAFYVAHTGYMLCKLGIPFPWHTGVRLFCFWPWHIGIWQERREVSRDFCSCLPSWQHSIFCLMKRALPNVVEGASTKYFARGKAPVLLFPSAILMCSAYISWLLPHQNFAAMQNNDCIVTYTYTYSPIVLPFPKLWWICNQTLFYLCFLDKKPKVIKWISTVSSTWNAPRSQLTSRRLL